MATARSDRRLAAVILAGGRGERLGGAVKAGLAVGGIRLLDRVAAALADIRGPILVAHGAASPDMLDLPAGFVPVADPPGWEGGPLGGIAAAAEWCLRQRHPPERLLSVAVDTPFFPADFAVLAMQALDASTDAVVARYQGQNYPTNTMWRMSALHALAADASHGEGGIKGFLGGLRKVELNWPAGPDGDPFANVNTPADLAAMQARANRRERA